jgi:hypothetical protein
MVTKTVAIYIFFDDILKSMSYKEPKSRKVTDAEVATVILPAAMYFWRQHGNRHQFRPFYRVDARHVEQKPL